MPLTDIAVRNAKPKAKAWKLFDERGLFLLVSSNGRKGWRFKFRYQGKEKLLSLGIYPDVSLAEAREQRDAARKLVAQGVDPSQARKQEKAESLAQGETFEVVTREWLEKTGPNLTPSYLQDVTRRLETYIFPYLGARPIREITAPELLAVIRRIESQGIPETAKRTLQKVGQILRYAVATGRAERDVSGDLRGALVPTKKQHRATMTDPRDVAALLRAIWDYEGSPVTRAALRISALTFCRPGEVRHMEWDELLLEAREWRIPAAKMKMREQHIVPLATQAMEALEAIRPLSGSSRYVFPSQRTQDRPMSNMTVNAALRRLGFAKEDMSAHGFRSMASTLLNEQGWNRDAIERQLAHGPRDQVRAAYNFAEYLPERRQMMQSWADYLDGLRTGARIIPMYAGQAMG